MKQYHYGVHVNSETPITGVASANYVLWLHEAIDSGIDLHLEEHCKDCPNEDHDDCRETDGSETLLVGDWKKNDAGLYEPDENGKEGYAAIVREFYAQAVFSKHTKRCSLCSSCYPGQADLESKGDFLAYDFPPNMYEEADRDV